MAISRQSLFIPILLLASILATEHWAFIQPAQAFMSFPPHSNVHREILSLALKDRLGKASLKEMAAGMDSQDNPMSANWSKSENHACDNKIAEAFSYIDKQTEEAVRLADRADKDRKARQKCLFTLGLAMHTVQDFYSHANYVEWLTAEKMPLEPIDRSKGAKISPTIRTCYYYFASTLKQEPFLSHEENVRRLTEANSNPKTGEKPTFRSEAEFAARKTKNDLDTALDYALKPGQLLHMELNKDSESQLEGKVPVQMGEGRKSETLFSLAKTLAVKDTVKQWQNFETLIKAKYGERAPAILEALRGQDRGEEN